MWIPIVLALFVERFFLTYWTFTKKKINWLYMCGSVSDSLLFHWSLWLYADTTLEFTITLYCLEIRECKTFNLVNSFFLPSNYIGSSSPLFFPISFRISLLHWPDPSVQCWIEAIRAARGPNLVEKVCSLLPLRILAIYFS